MSLLTKPTSEIEALTNRLEASLICDKPHKSDFREQLDLASPVSPLRTTRNNPIATPSSSSSSSGSVSGKPGSTNVNPGLQRSNDGVRKNHSGELSGSSGTSLIAGRSGFKPGHRRSNSAGAPLIYSGGGSVNSPSGNVGNVLPMGNICPSGKIPKTSMVHRSLGTTRSDVLGTGMGNYGHGSIMRGGGSSSAKSGEVRTGSTQSMVSLSDPEVVKVAGNEEYKKGHFAEALCLYERAVSIAPNNAAYRSNKAAALTGLGRLGEAVLECEEAVRLDSGYARAHQRLASLHLRLGQVECSRSHLRFPGQQTDAAELKKLQAVESHMKRCADARKIGDWKSAMREGDAAIAAGAHSSPQLFACRAEALLKLHQLQDADSSLAIIPKVEPYPLSYAQGKVFGMLSESYIFFVQAQIDMALGRFENAVVTAEKAGQIDPLNNEISVVLNNVRLVARARARGNHLFNSGKFSEACSAYGDGLKFDPSNSVLYCNRAACWSKLRQWERSVDDCNHALRIQPHYTKALLRRASSNCKLERWAESVRDYEVLRRELPGDNEVAEDLFHAQVALKKSRGEEVINTKFGGEVVEIFGLGQFRTAISSPGISVVLFKTKSNQQCQQISTFFNTLCDRYPSANFLKVDLEQSLAVANAENVRTVPTFKIYKNGRRVKEMFCPTQEVLEYSVRHYSL
ncbi:hypothetical protein GIB67_000167 [Kingdonia uniflora]|uniref:Thioredoxin domain-containing protein n=1 Tax=Kingdonia uniflora TaxID=39325 RepID=A0A7J7P9P8_9MAGN|nr:hypothetical protein GIB67_000167 [Kingdonia uniflora]